MTLVDYFPKLIDKRVPISALKIPPRVFLNWKEAGVIDITSNQILEEATSSNRKTTRKWAYLNAFDTLWLLIVKELRKFNLDLKTIIQLKEFLFELNDLKEMIANADNKQLNAFMDITLSDEIKQLVGIERIDLGVQLSEIQKFEDEYKNFLNRIGNIFFSVLIMKHSPSILIYRNKDSDQVQFEIFEKEYFLTCFSKEKLYLEMEDKFSSDIFINISIVNLFAVLFEDENFDKFNTDFEFYNYREQKVLELLRNDDYKEITIKKGNDGLLHLESKSQIEFKNEKAKEIRKIMGLKEYDRIELIQRNDKHIIINKTNKEKL